MEEIKCLICGGKLEHIKVIENKGVGGCVMITDVPKLKCTKCGQTFYSEKIFSMIKYFSEMHFFTEKELNLKGIVELPFEEVERKYKRKYTKKQIKSMLIREYKKKGRVLNLKEIAENKELPSLSTIYTYFHTTKMREIWKEVLYDLNRR